MKLRRMALCLCLSLLAIIISLLFNMSQKVQLIENRLQHVQSETQKEQEKIRVLQAEWQYLTRPGRLEKLARTYTMLRPADGGENIAMARIPALPASTGNNQPENNTDLASAEPLYNPAQDHEDIHPDYLPRTRLVRVSIPPKPAFKPGTYGPSLKEIAWKGR